MNRETIYFLEEGSTESTFCYDENLPRLPLPPLDHTLKRYLESLKPFGTADELENSKKIIETFRVGVGAKLQKLLEQRAVKEKNWVDKWWEDYAYCTLRLPLIPYCVMVQPLLLDTVGLEVIPENFLKSSATCLHHNMVFWKMLRQEKLRPIASADKRVIFSAEQYRRLYNTVRLPGADMDRVQSYFKTEREGPCPSHVIVLYDGRIFKVPGLDVKGEPLSPQAFLFALQQVQAKVEGEGRVDHAGVPVLTNDDRTTWARNRNRLIELSRHNKEAIEEIESAVALLILDSHQPTGYSELAQLALTGDVRSKWADKSCGTIAFKNGQMGCYGEHCCYDGSISISISLYVMMSIMEEGVPDWTIPPKEYILPVEVVFDLDDNLRTEIIRMEQEANEMKTSVLVSMDQFQEYGKAFMKKHKVHPDAYVQTALLLTYYRLHGTFAPTYETAMMRQYYKGRTETCRSCSIETVRFIEAMEKGTDEPISNRAKLFRAAANRQMELMNEARKGNGIDRHLFGLWCVAHENGIPIPELYDDPLYAKSGGGGNFVLSTSTLGYTINCGFVAPMCNDGYGCFYTMLEDSIWAIFSAYRDSSVTSGHKFQQTFHQVMLDLKELLESAGEIGNKL
ncbi:peroxisomal carnitine O-octanoyltransferase-like [Anopheles albimanus]|uniref:peroxisomal carnitine O-octanoyltransferase-like n=1 Tax=Anopheles albimanus TaxID=7167 RepID=UPI0016400EC1|nr:peroxisomal carnitine O-octanoyltransferase-like [Anopheles albimanus]